MRFWLLMIYAAMDFCKTWKNAWAGLGISDGYLFNSYLKYTCTNLARFMTLEVYHFGICFFSVICKLLVFQFPNRVVLYCLQVLSQVISLMSNDHIINSFCSVVFISNNFPKEFLSQSLEPLLRTNNNVKELESNLSTCRDRLQWY